MPSTSSLLRSAQATQKVIQQQQDSLVAYEWGNSAQTYDEYVQYSKYLKGRLKANPDASSQISYATKLRGALRTYTSNEIQRQQINIIEGGATLSDKLDTIGKLYSQAVANGDAGLAQNLRSQYDSTSVQMQREQAAQAKALVSSGRSGATAVSKAFKAQVSDALSDYDGDINFLNETVRKTGEGDDWKDAISRVNKVLPEELKLNPNTGFFDNLANVVEAKKALLEQVIQASPDETTKAYYQKKYNTFATSTIAKLPGLNGETTSLTPADLETQIGAAQVGESLFTPTQTPNGLAFVRNKVDNYAWGRDAQGNYKLIPTYSIGGSQLDSYAKDANGNEIKVNGNTIKYSDLLKSAGFNVSGSNLVQGTTATQLGIPGIVGDEAVQVYIDQDGKLQVLTGDNESYALNFDESGKYIGAQAIEPSAITPLQSDKTRFSNPYLNTLDQSQIPEGAIGLIDPNLSEQQLKKIQDFQLAKAKTGGNTASNFLQSNLLSSQLQQDAASAKKLALQKTIPAHKIQPTVKPQQLQKTSNPFNLPRVTKLNVKPIPQQKISGTSVIKSKQKISNVSNYQPTQGINLHVGY